MMEQLSTVRRYAAEYVTDAEIESHVAACIENGDGLYAWVARRDRQGLLPVVVKKGKKQLFAMSDAGFGVADGRYYLFSAYLCRDQSVSWLTLDGRSSFQVGDRPLLESFVDGFVAGHKANLRLDLRKQQRLTGRMSDGCD